MTKTRSPRNNGAKAAIELDGIRTAAREIRTLFPEADRPALNTLMNTMTRELGLGQSYGAALAAVQQPPAPGALPADHLMTITAKMSCPEWIASMMQVFAVVHTTNETFRGQPVFDLRFNKVPMTGSPEDAGLAAQGYLATHSILGRADVKIRKIKVEISETLKQHPPSLQNGRPIPRSFDPSFMQDLPAGFWVIDSVLLFELERSAPLDALLRRIAKAPLYDGANKIYSPTRDLALRNGPNDKPLLAIRIERKLITADPRTALAHCGVLTEILQRKMRIKINAKEMVAFEQATCISQAITSMSYAPLSFRLDPVRSMNGRTVADPCRPALLVDTGAALADVSPSSLDDGKRDAQTDARIAAMAGVEPADADGYKIRLLRPSRPRPAG